MLINSALITAILLIAAKALLRGQPDVDFFHVFGLVFVTVIIANIGVSAVGGLGLGMIGVLLVILLVSLVVAGISGIMYEWGKVKSSIFGAVFGIAFFGVTVLSSLLVSPT